MSKKDNQEIDPVESIEDMVSSAIIELEPEEETEDLTVEEPEDEKEDTGEPEDNPDTDPDEPEVDDTESSETAEDDGTGSEEDIPEDVEGDKLEAPEHWAAKDRETFSNQPKEAQEYILERHKAMEGDYTRKSQSIATIQRQHDAIQDVLSPYEQEFAQAGLDQVGAIRQLASWHSALKSGDKSSVLQLAKMYGIDMAETESDEYVDPQVQAVQNELALLKQEQARNTQAAQQDKQKQLYDVIRSFEGEKDEGGALKHPHFETLKDDITRLFQAGIASDLGDGYVKALAMRPDLAVVKQPAPVVPIKTDQAAKVKKAKKAATGVKSSGAVGKINRDKMTLEQEVASHFQ